ncbi:MAG: ABC transporter permease [Planctomycetota bacterium]|jgi:Cu-processing system permease protein
MTTLSIASDTKAHCPSASRSIVVFARRELRDALTSKWFPLFTAAFTLLAIATSYMSLAASGSQGFAGFAKTSAGLLNLVMLIVPLMALCAGASTISSERERGTLLYLLAQPVSRLELLLGKVLGLSIALCASLCLGFGLSAIVLAMRSGGADLSSFLVLVGMTCLLAIVMLTTGVLISVLTRKASVSTGIAVFVWLILVFLSDLGLMAGSLLFKLRVQELFAGAIINPLQSFKMSVILNINASLDVLGPVGVYATRTFGDSLTWLLLAVIVAWGLVSLGIASWIFSVRKPI